MPIAEKQSKALEALRGLQLINPSDLKRFGGRVRYFWIDRYLANVKDRPEVCMRKEGGTYERAKKALYDELNALREANPTAVSNYDFVTVRAFHLVPPHVKTIRGYLCTDKNNNSEVLNEATNQVP